MALLLLCLFSGRVNAQDENHYVQVELKSGPVVKGELIEMVYQEKVELKLPMGDTMVILWDDILELNFINSEVKEEYRANQVRVKRPPLAYKDSGLYASFDISPPFGRDYWGDPVMGFSTQVALNKPLRNGHSIGAITGFEFYLWPDIGFIPLGLEWRYRPKTIGRSPVFSLNAGYGSVAFSEYSWFTSSSNVKGGLFFSPAIGLTNKKHAKRSWYLRGGYKMQEAFTSYEGFVRTGGLTVPSTVEETIVYHRIEFRFGVIWN
jgi:hypothetical protein